MNTNDRTGRSRTRGGQAMACALVALCMAMGLALAGRAVAQPGGPMPPAVKAASPLGRQVTAVRLGNGPVIYPGMPGLEGELGTNIDGPSVIKAPSWLKHPLGKYYMYFAHHRGTYIRLAYADRPEGPWHVYKPGTLRLDQTTAINHIASPDVMVDDAHKRFVLYVHGPIEPVDGHYGGRPYMQRTFVATSSDGIHFGHASGPFAQPYMKTFRYKGAVYGLAMSDKQTAYPLWLRSGQFFRSATGMPPFAPGPRILTEMRHAAVLVQGHVLDIFYTVVGDKPERILFSQVDLRPDWTEWTASAPTEVLRPEKAYEGADEPMEASKGGMSGGRERALRDPAILDDDGQVYLYYSVAGELGIAVARVTLPKPAAPPKP
jgi:hypothetical protein